MSSCVGKASSGSNRFYYRKIANEQFASVSVGGEIELEIVFVQRHALYAAGFELATLFDFTRRVCSERY
jgi:hypothetical protein